MIIKIQDEYTEVHHTATLNCEENGLQLLSFKLGRLEIDASTDEYGGDELKISNKFVVSGVEIEEDADPIEFFSLVTQVYDTKNVDFKYIDP